MFVGKVIGTVWSTVKWPEVQGLKLLVVRPYHLSDLADLSHLAKVGDLGDLAASSPSPVARTKGSAASDASPHPGGGPDCEAVICVDLLDAGVGDDVVVAFGHAARVAAQMEGSQTAGGQKSLGGRQNGGPSPNNANANANAASGDPHQKPGTSASPMANTIVPIDAAVVAIVDSIEVSRPQA